MVCHNCQVSRHRPATALNLDYPHADAVKSTETRSALRGHTAANCPHYERPPRCNHCNDRQSGHRRQNCPSVTCSRCYMVGHSAHICPVPLGCDRCNSRTLLARVARPAFPRDVRSLPRSYHDNAGVNGFPANVILGDRQ